MGVIFTNGVGVGTVPNNNNGWISVTNNGGDGSISQTGQTMFSIVGPNNNGGNEWLYIKKQFQTSGTLNISYHWTNNDTDGAGNDWPIYEVTSTEPTGRLGTYNTSQLNDTNSVDETNSWSISYNAGDWVAIGLYSTDSCCGFGTLNFTVNNQTNSAGQWYLATGGFGYQPAWTNGVITWTLNDLGGYGTNDPNTILGGNTAGIYINLYDSTGFPHYELISAVAGRTGTITFTQGSNYITYGFTPGTFIDATGMFNSLEWGPGGSTDPLTLVSTSNTTFTGYENGDNNPGALTYTGSGIGPNNTQLIEISYTTDAPSFTLTSADMNYGYGNYNSWNGHNYPEALGTNGVDGFTLTYYSGQPSYLSYASNVPYVPQITNQSIINFFDNLVSSNVLTSGETTLWSVEWGPGSTHSKGIVSLRSIGTNAGTQMPIAPLDTTDSTWNQPGNNTTALEGTYYLPAKFTLMQPVFSKGGWC